MERELGARREEAQGLAARLAASEEELRGARERAQVIFWPASRLMPTRVCCQTLDWTAMVSSGGGATAEADLGSAMRVPGAGAAREGA